jgi:alkanesulfonate monooxygenase SsuD/methylene tetrahydromethanopterin reductase-like flavin-dependent oxidoreductase (luciferase family)
VPHSLAVAAGATTTLRVGTWVLVTPLRAPRLAAWDAHTLSLLSSGRFELGIGTGRPEAATEAVQVLEQPELTMAQRLARVERTIDDLRALDGDEHTPVLVAAGERLLLQRERHVHRAVRARGGAPGRPVRRRLDRWRPGRESRAAGTVSCRPSLPDR